jgi:phosphatidylserine/phosphatidylglycerophosphate/cardiolipin synthase-like enzyme
LHDDHAAHGPARDVRRSDRAADLITSLIDGAQHTLDVQMYLFTVHAIADRIVAAHDRGVAVRVILDPGEAGNAAVRPRFSAGGVAVRDANAIYPFSHAKYLLIDRKTAVIMSMNFNIDAMNNERNFGMVDQDLEDVGDTQQIFDMDWALANGMQPQAANLKCTRLMCRPSTHTRSRPDQRLALDARRRGPLHHRRHRPQRDRRGEGARRHGARDPRGPERHRVERRPHHVLQERRRPGEVRDDILPAREADHLRRHRVRRLREHVADVARSEPRGRALVFEPVPAA